MRKKPDSIVRRRARKDTDKLRLREKILLAARQELATGTAESVSIQKIADAAGYSKATILKYFPSKIALLLFVKEKNLQEAVDRLEDVMQREKEPIQRLRCVAVTYIEYWLANPDHFKSLYTMAGTKEDRRLPDGTYFGQTPVARRSVEIFVECTEDLLRAAGATPSTETSRKLATLLFSATHGIISLPLGTPTMEWRDVASNGSLVVDSLLCAWTMGIEAARSERSWPKVSIKFLEQFMATQNR